MVHVTVKERDQLWPLLSPTQFHLKRTFFSFCRRKKEEKRKKKGKKRREKKFLTFISRRRVFKRFFLSLRGSTLPYFSTTLAACCHSKQPKTKSKSIRNQITRSRQASAKMYLTLPRMIDGRSACDSRISSATIDDAAAFSFDSQFTIGSVTNHKANKVRLLDR